MYGAGRRLKLLVTTKRGWFVLAVVGVVGFVDVEYIPGYFPFSTIFAQLMGTYLVISFPPDSQELDADESAGPPTQGS